MCNSWHIDPRLKSSYGYDIEGFIPELSLETGFSLSKKVSIIVFGIPVVVVVSELLSQYFAFSIVSVVDYVFLLGYQTSQPGFYKFLDFYWSSPILNLEYGVLDINTVTRYTDIEGVLQLYSLFKFSLVKQRQSPSQEYKWVVQIMQKYQSLQFSSVFVSSSKYKIILVDDYSVELFPDTQIGSLL